MEASREVRVAFWVTAGGRHGGGHLSRSMALIDALPANWKTVLVLPDNEYTRTLHSVGGPAVATHPEVQGWSPRMIFHCIESQGWKEGPELIVIDGLWTPESELAAELRKRWPETRVAVIGGLEQAHFDVDLRVIPDAGFQPPDAENAPLEEAGGLIGGAPFVILGRSGEPRPWSPPPTPARVLVTAGNADPFDATSLFIVALEGCTEPVAATVVLGGGFLHADRVRERVAVSTADLELVERVHDLRPLMLESDLALAAFGVTCVELAQMGVPTLAVAHTEADLPRARRVAEQGFMQSAGWVETSGSVAIAATVDGLLGSPDTLRAMSEAGRTKIDGLGARRVAEALRALLEP